MRGAEHDAGLRCDAALHDDREPVDVRDRVTGAGHVADRNAEGLCLAAPDAEFDPAPHDTVIG